MSKRRSVFTPDTSDVFDEPIYWVPVPDVKKLKIPKFVPRETPALVWSVRDQLDYELRASKRRRKSTSTSQKQPTEQRDGVRGPQTERVVAEDSPTAADQEPREEKHGAKPQDPQ